MFDINIQRVRRELPFYSAFLFLVLALLLHPGDFRVVIRHDVNIAPVLRVTGF